MLQLRSSPKRVRTLQKLSEIKWFNQKIIGTLIKALYLFVYTVFRVRNYRKKAPFERSLSRTSSPFMPGSMRSRTIHSHSGFFAFPALLLLYKRALQKTHFKALGRT